jgi:hypothetical protein
MVELVEPVLDDEMQVVPLVEDLALHVRVKLLEQPNFAILLGDQLLVHRGDLDEEVVIRQIEIWGEELDRVSVVIADRETAGLVFPGNCVEIEEECELSLTVVSEVDVVCGQGLGVQGAPTSTTPDSSTSSGKS